MLVCDKPNAFAIERANQHGSDVFTFVAKDYESKAAYEQDILKQLHSYGVEFIALAGYMRLIGETLLSAYKQKIVNIHPSLLPSFPGKDAIGQAFEAKVKVTGVTIHFVDEGMDTGPIIAQEAVTVDENETKESLTKKIQVVEHKLYTETLKKII